MEWRLVLENFLSPPILFFFLGVLAVTLKSDLQIPQPFPKVLSLYLLFSIGLKGGAELAHSGIHREVVMGLLAAVLMAVLVPIYTFFILRRKLDASNAAAIAATYGSISAVTFLTASSYLQKMNVRYGLALETGGYMVAAMALMESPAIVVGVLLVRGFRKSQSEEEQSSSWSELLGDAFFNGPVFLLVGSLLIGTISGEKGHEAVAPLTDSLFKGVLTFFLLDMGLLAARQLRDLRQAGAFLGIFALVIPVVNAIVGIFVARMVGISNRGTALLFATLCSSASYIAVPAAVRIAIPDANPSFYLPMALGVTFPWNISFGIPLYYVIVSQIWR